MNPRISIQSIIYIYTSWFLSMVTLSIYNVYPYIHIYTYVYICVYTYIIYISLTGLPLIIPCSRSCQNFWAKLAEVLSANCSGIVSTNCCANFAYQSGINNWGSTSETLFFYFNRAFRLVVQSSFVFASRNCDWLK